MSAQFLPPDSKMWWFSSNFAGSASSHSSLVCFTKPLSIAGVKATDLATTSPAWAETEDPQTRRIPTQTLSWILRARLVLIFVMTRWTPVETETGAGTSPAQRKIHWPRPRLLEEEAEVEEEEIFRDSTQAGPLTQPSPPWLPPASSPRPWTRSRPSSGASTRASPGLLSPTRLPTPWTRSPSPSLSPSQDSRLLSRVISSSCRLRARQVGKCWGSGAVRDHILVSQPTFLCQILF